jgi:ribosomal protein L19E
MQQLSKARKLAASLMGCSLKRVRFELKEDQSERKKHICSRDKIRTYIQKGWISRRTLRGISRNEARLKAPRRDTKTMWMRRVRRLRKALRQYSLKGTTHRKVYLAIKSGHVVSRQGLKTFIES